MNKYIVAIVIVAIVSYIYYIQSIQPPSNQISSPPPTPSPSPFNPTPSPSPTQPSNPTPSPSPFNPSPTLSAEEIKKRMKDIEIVMPTQNPVFIAQTSASAYPLTEMAIKLSFNPSSTFNQSSESQFNSLFSTLTQQYILDRMKNDGKNINRPYDISFLQCYVLYTNTFLNPYSETNRDQYKNEYDIIGAYMFLNLKSYVNNDTLFEGCKYYETTHQLYLSKDVLTSVLAFTKRVDTDNAFFFINVKLPIALDNFVLRIGRYVYSNFAQNYKTINTWVNMKSSCS
jgi:hypothetical protein